ncbi:hypothetical protein [Ferruginibacter sp.]
MTEAIAATQKFFDNQSAPAESLTLEDLEKMESSGIIEFSRDKINAGIDIVSFLAETGIFPSKGEARKTATGGGVSINRKKADAIDMQVNAALLLHDKYILVQKGKKNNYVIKAV